MKNIRVARIALLAAFIICMQINIKASQKSELVCSKKSLHLLPPSPGADRYLQPPFKNLKLMGMEQIDVNEERPIWLQFLNITNEDEDVEHQCTIQFFKPCFGHNLLQRGMVISITHIQNEKAFLSFYFDESIIDKLDLSESYIFFSYPRLSMDRIHQLKVLDFHNHSLLHKIEIRICNNLTTIDNTDKCSQLKKFYMSNCKVKKLSFKQCKCLRKIDVYEMEELEEIHLPENGKLESIIINDCDNLRVFDGVKGNSNLKEITLFQCSKIENLDLEGCTSLEDFSNYFLCSLRYMNVKNCHKLNDLSPSSKNLERLDGLGQGSCNPEKIFISDFNSRILNISGCTKLKNFCFLAENTVSIRGIDSCHNIEKLDMLVRPTNIDISKLKKLITFDIRFCQEDGVFTGYENLVNLEEFIIQRFSSIEHLDISNLTKLRRLRVEDSTSIKTIVGISNCHNLEEVILEDLPHLEGSLDLSQCHNLQTVKIIKCKSFDRNNLTLPPNKEINISIKYCTEMSLIDEHKYLAEQTKSAVKSIFGF